MVGKIIRDYMEGGGRKLTVPGFGTFMRRDGGGVIFVDLLRGDDRVLAGMIQRTGGLSEVEAAARIDRFIFETRGAIERTGRAEIAGFGTVTADAKGVYGFDYSPRTVGVQDTSRERVGAPEPSQSVQSSQLSQSSQVQPTQSPQQPQQQSQPQPQVQARPTQPMQPQPTQPQVRPLQSPSNLHTTQAHSHSQARPQDGAPQRRPDGAPNRAQGGSPNKVQGGVPNRTQGGVPGRAQGGTSNKVQSGTPNRASANAPRRGPAPTRRSKPAAHKPSTTDRILLIAIIAAAIALAAMIFGLTSSASHIPFVNK